MSSAAAARLREQVADLPIDLLIAALEDALLEIGEIVSRRGVGFLQVDTSRPAQLEQIQRLHDCGVAVEVALDYARSYAKGPSA